MVGHHQRNVFDDGDGRECGGMDAAGHHQRTRATVAGAAGWTRRGITKRMCSTTATVASGGMDLVAVWGRGGDGPCSLITRENVETEPSKNREQEGSFRPSIKQYLTKYYGWCWTLTLLKPFDSG